MRQHEPRHRASLSSFSWLGLLSRLFDTHSPFVRPLLCSTSSHLSVFPLLISSIQTVFQQNWNEAHRMFREKVKGIQKTVVDTTRDSDSEEEDGATRRPRGATGAAADEQQEGLQDA